MFYDKTTCILCLCGEIAYHKVKKGYAIYFKCNKCVSLLRDFTGEFNFWGFLKKGVTRLEELRRKPSLN